MQLTQKQLITVLDFFTYFQVDEKEPFFVSEDGNTAEISNGEITLNYENPDFDFTGINPLELNEEEYRKYAADSTITKTIPMPETVEDLVKILGEINFVKEEDELNELFEEVKEYLEDAPIPQPYKTNPKPVTALVHPTGEYPF